MKGCQEQLATHLEQEYSKVKVSIGSFYISFVEHQRVFNLNYFIVVLLKFSWKNPPVLFSSDVSVQGAHDPVPVPGGGRPQEHDRPPGQVGEGQGHGSQDSAEYCLSDG